MRPSSGLRAPGGRQTCRARVCTTGEGCEGGAVRGRGRHTMRRERTGWARSVWGDEIKRNHVGAVHTVGRRRRASMAEKDKRNAPYKLRSVMHIHVIACLVLLLAMSSLASQLVLHPYVSQSLKYGATNLGRDKVSPSAPPLRTNRPPLALPHRAVPLPLPRLVLPLPWKQARSCPLECAQEPPRPRSKA